MKILLFVKISVLKNFACIAGFEACNFFIKRLQLEYFPVNFLRTLFSTEQLQWLLFKIRNSNNLFKDVSGIFYAQPSPMSCNPDNDKLI